MQTFIFVAASAAFFATCVFTTLSLKEQKIDSPSLDLTVDIVPCVSHTSACLPRNMIFSHEAPMSRFELVNGVTSHDLRAREIYIAGGPKVKAHVGHSHAVYLICSCDRARLDLLRHNRLFFDTVHVMACESCVPGASDVQRRDNVDMHMTGFRYMKEYCTNNSDHAVTMIEDDYLVTDLFVDQLRALAEMFPRGLPFFSAYRHPQGATVFNKHMASQVVYLEHRTHSFVTWPVASMTFTVGCGAFLAFGQNFPVVYADVDNFSDIYRRGTFLVAPVISSMQHLGRNLTPEPYWATHMVIGNRTADIFSRLLCDKLGPDGKK